MKYYLKILQEFEYANPNIDAAAFINKWPEMWAQFRYILIDHYKVNTFTTDWSEEVENILVLLKMFPSKQVGKNVIASNINFNKSVESFLHFEPVSLMNSIQIRRS